MNNCQIFNSQVWIFIIVPVRKCFSGLYTGSSIFTNTYLNILTIQGTYVHKYVNVIFLSLETHYYPTADVLQTVNLWVLLQLLLGLLNLFCLASLLQLVTAALDSLLICLIEVSLHSKLKVTLWYA